LSANAAVVDERGVVVASDRHEQIGEVFDTEPLASSYLRIPLNLDTAKGEVVVSGSETGEVISPRLAHVLVDLIINQTAVVDRLPNSSDLKNKFIHDLLLGDARNESTILREAEVLGMDFNPPRAVILIDASDFIMPSHPDIGEDILDELVTRRAHLVIAGVVGFFDLPSDTICAYIGNGEVVVLKASSTKDLFAWTEMEEGMDQWGASWTNLTALKRAGTALVQRLHADTGSTINIGIGRYHPGLRGLASSYQDARVALSLGRRFQKDNRVHCLDGLGVAAFVGVADEKTKVDLASHLLSPLDHEPELLVTLDAFFKSDGSASCTAGHLNIHRNTLSYRLDKITSLTGLDPRRFDDAVQIRVAMILRTLRDS
jgi:carbohydrate diacid regulator